MKENNNFTPKENIVINYFLNGVADDRREYDIDDLIKSLEPVTVD